MINRVHIKSNVYPIMSVIEIYVAELYDKQVSERLKQYANIDLQFCKSTNIFIIKIKPCKFTPTKCSLFLLRSDCVVACVNEPRQRAPPCRIPRVHSNSGPQRVRHPGSISVSTS